MITVLLSALCLAPIQEPVVPATPEVVTIELPMKAIVGGTSFTLGEIARVGGDGAASVAGVAAWELGYAPSPGYSRLIFADRLERQLAVNFPDVQVKLSGQRATRVWPKTEVLPSAEIQRVAAAELQRVFATVEATFRLRGPLSRVEIPAGRGERNLRARLRAQRLNGSVIQVPVDVFIDGSLYRTLYTTWDVEAWQTVPVLARKVPAGTPIPADAIQSQRIPMRGTAQGRAMTAADLAGTIAGRDLKPGEVVTHVDVQRPTAVAFGTQLLLSVRKGPVRAKVPVVALEPGSIGDRIKVRALDSNQELTATIVRRDLVEIDLR